MELQDNVSGPAGNATGALSGLASKFGGAGDASEGLAGKMGGLAESFDPVSMAITVAVVALTALAGALYAGVSAAISLSQEKDQLISTFDALGGGAGAGQKTIDMLDRMSESLPFATDKLQKWAKSLMAAGLQGPKLETAIKAIAASTAIMGEAGGAATETLIKKFSMAAETGGKVKLDSKTLKQLALAGVAASDLANQLGTTPDKLASMTVGADKLGKAMQDALIGKGSKALQGMSLTWDSIKSKLADGFGDIFEDMGPLVQPLMDAVKSLFGEFGKGKSTITGLKAVATQVFGTLFAVATRVVNGIHTGFLRLQILWFKVSIALKPITDGIKKLLPAGAGISILMGIVKGLAVVFAILAISVIIALIPFMLLAAAIVLVGFVIAEAIGFIVDIVNYLEGLGEAAGNAGKDFVSGLINGIGSMAGQLISAVAGLAGSAVNALASALHLGSPSKLTMKMGKFTSQGLADGIENGTGAVETAAKGAGGAAIGGVANGLDGAAGASGKSGKGAGGGINVVVQAGAILINGAGNVLELTEEAVSIVFERIALEQGLAT